MSHLPATEGLVSISLVCYNGLECLLKCLSAIYAQTYPAIEIIVVDNASTDSSVGYIQEHFPNAKLIVNKYNAGFCAAGNQGIRTSQGEYVLILNQDIMLEPTFIEEMVKAASVDSSIGIVSGKLYRIGKFFEFDEHYRKHVLDSTGFSWLPNGRHPDRGAGEVDTGQYEKMEYVFGASGAAPLFRRTMLEDIAFEGQYFDEDFYFGHEDVDLCWRAQIAGWKAIYTPHSVAYHVRTSRPDNRRELPRWMKIHSTKNRFMIRVKNMTVWNFLQCAPFMLSRDILVLGGMILFEPYSFRGLWFFFNLVPRNFHKRQFIMSKRRVSDKYIRQWFRWRPRAIPLQEVHE